MSGKIAGKVWKMDLPRPKKFVLLAMADFANGNGSSVKPSIKTIAAQTGYSERHVARIINDLRNDGLLHLVKSGRAEGRPSEYRIDVSADSVEVETASPTPESAEEKSDPVGYDIVSEGVGHGVIPGMTQRQGGMTSGCPTGYDIQMSYDPPLILKAAAATPEPARHNAFVLYEKNISMINQIVGEQIKDALSHYPAGWVEDAIGEAALNNAKSWRYIEAILKRWEREGRKAKPTNGAKPPAKERKSNPSCPKCHGQFAFQAANLKEGHPLYNKAIPCPECMPVEYQRFIDAHKEAIREQR